MLREHNRNEHLEEDVHINRSNERRIWDWRALVDVREANTSRLINEQERCLFVPAESIVDRTIAMIIDEAWAEFCNGSALSLEQSLFQYSPCNRPSIEEQPGPPLIHSVKGVPSGCSTGCSVAKYLDQGRSAKKS